MVGGSSLRAQGTPVRVRVYGGCVRFIPAGAGNTEHSTLGLPNGSVHPCGRREHLDSRANLPAAAGSSLRAQGTRTTSVAPCTKRRFIPAGAGNTADHVLILYDEAVHPCGRREHIFRPFPGFAVNGSSLRAQGTPIPLNKSNTFIRFIPAGAGNTRKQPRQRQLEAVHPCGRREHYIRLKIDCNSTGSSLRAQGTQKGHTQTVQCLRFIPAGAGNTSSLRPEVKTRSVHPCGRREHVHTDLVARQSDGSSLRAQGTPLAGDRGQ